MVATTTRTRSATSTCTKSRVDAVLDLFTGDLAAFIARDLVGKDSAIEWLNDITDVLVLESVERFQIKITFPNGKTIGLDYEVSDDGRVKNTDASGGFSTSSIPDGSTVYPVIRWRANAPQLEAARKLLRDRGWGPGSMVEGTSAIDRAYADGGYAIVRRFAGEWPQ